MGVSLIPQSNHGITVKGQEEGLGYMSCSSSGVSSCTSVDSSSSSDFLDDATSSDDKKGPLDEMSSLMVQLPLKRGLSRFYQGKSQSFACLSDVRCLEDLAKPERPLKKKLKSSGNCGGGNLDSHRSLSTKVCSKVIMKKGSRAGSLCSPVNARRNHSFLRSRPPIPQGPQQRAGNISSHRLLIT